MFVQTSNRPVVSQTRDYACPLALICADLQTSACRQFANELVKTVICFRWMGKRAAGNQHKLLLLCDSFFFPSSFLSFFIFILLSVLSLSLFFFPSFFPLSVLLSFSSSFLLCFFLPTFSPSFLRYVSAVVLHCILF